MGTSCGNVAKIAKGTQEMTGQGKVVDARLGK